MKVDTPITYTRKESEQIRRRFAHGQAELDCPRCGEPLLYGPCIERNGKLLSEVYCQICHRVVMVHVADEELIGDRN